MVHWVLRGPANDNHVAPDVVPQWAMGVGSIVGYPGDIRRGCPQWGPGYPNMVDRTRHMSWCIVGNGHWATAHPTMVNVHVVIDSRNGPNVRELSWSLALALAHMGWRIAGHCMLHHCMLPRGACAMRQGDTPPTSPIRRRGQTAWAPQQSAQSENSPSDITPLTIPGTTTILTR